MSEVTATDHVHDLADAGEISAAIADRLDDNRYETVADLLIADQEDLEDVPYVGEQRAADILEVVDGIETPAPEPREIDVESTESAVTETERDGDNDDTPLPDSREVALEASLGERVRLTFVEKRDWSDTRVVVATEEPTTWETPTGDSWRTRRIRISSSATRQPDAKEYDLVVGADGVWIVDPDPAGRYAESTSEAVESVAVVGRVSQSSYYQLKGKQEETTVERPEGDDTWRKYQRGEA